ncbi:MAG TPA: zincin-like metallopeptidase domain-containing protein [Terriglobales bacterium]|nr:zincin-like metallopeptidase domain-containing protein [Terriglobales bacterium]
MPSVYEVITARIIEQLESGTAPWQKPWKVSGTNGLPRNLVTDRPYRGINNWMLLSSGFGSPYWLTFRQAGELKGHVRKGEKGLPVVYWKFGTREVQDGDETVEKTSVLCRFYTVFNIDQCEGISAPEKLTEPTLEVKPIDACERIVNGWVEKPAIQHGGDRASYHKITDCVRMPNTTAFESMEEYYSTLFHELTHSTGHPTRLNRSTLMDAESFGDQNYSREELVAEMGAAFLAGYCGIESRTINNSSSYLANWLDALKNDSRMVLVAASQAQKAADLILGVIPSDAGQPTTP